MPSPSRQTLRDRRIKLGIRLDEVAKDWGYADPTAISRWERELKKFLPGKRTPEDYAATLDRINGSPRVSVPRVRVASK